MIDLTMIFWLYILCLAVVVCMVTLQGLLFKQGCDILNVMKMGLELHKEAAEQTIKSNNELVELFKKTLLTVIEHEEKSKERGGR